MIILGLDVGYSRCGVCVLDVHNEAIKFIGTIQTGIEYEFQDRLNELNEDLFEINKKFNPKYVFLEKLFFSRENKEFEKVCISKGVIYSVFMKKSKIVEVYPLTMKKLITGSGNAKKKDLRKIFKMMFESELRSISDDALDALGLALTGRKLLISSSVTSKVI